MAVPKAAFLLRLMLISIPDVVLIVLADSVAISTIDLAVSDDSQHDTRLAVLTDQFRLY